MHSAVSGGTADRIAARIFFKVPRAGSGTPARYSSTFFGATLLFALEPRASDCHAAVRSEKPCSASRLASQECGGELISSDFTQGVHEDNAARERSAGPSIFSVFFSRRDNRHCVY